MYLTTQVLVNYTGLQCWLRHCPCIYTAEENLYNSTFEKRMAHTFCVFKYKMF
jgi:hypothetical protein